MISASVSKHPKRYQGFMKRDFEGFIGILNGIKEFMKGYLEWFAGTLNGIKVFPKS